jgi:hypothetical protein
VLTS